MLGLADELAPLQVPLMYTVYALINFRKFKTLEGSPDPAGKSEDWYVLPAGYTLKTFDEIAATKRHRRSQSWDSADYATTEEDAKVLQQMGL